MKLKPVHFKKPGRYNLTNFIPEEEVSFYDFTLFR